jgi:hypothetical protein
MTSLEERRHQLDKVQTFKIIKGHFAAEKGQGFSMAANSTVNTRQAVETKPGETEKKLQRRMNYFSVRLVDE